MSAQLKKIAKSSSKQEEILAKNEALVEAQGGLPEGEAETGQTEVPKTDAPKTIAPEKKDTANEVVTLVLPKGTVEKPVYLITPKNDPLYGTDRWFKKTDLKATDVNEDGQFVIQLTRKLVASRGLTALIQTGAAAE